MFRLRRIGLATAAVCACGASAAFAVGLGPLEKSGITASERKGFYLTVSNPYKEVHEFRAYVEDSSGIDISRIDIRPAISPIAPQSSRRVLVIVNDLQPGEDVSFNVCAERIEERKVVIHARVCSKLNARRIRPRD